MKLDKSAYLIKLQFNERNITKYLSLMKTSIKVTRGNSKHLNEIE